MDVMNTNSFEYAPAFLPEIETKLENDGYVRIQFSEEYLPTGDDFIRKTEQFFIEFIENIGGQCLDHNEHNNSYVWHVKPIDSNLNGTQNQHLARSHTDHEFAFHTDCSYERNPAEYIALFVLEPDKLGGGELETIKLSDILDILSLETKEYLFKTKFQINVPLEFRKSPDIHYIDSTILFDHDKIRYRSDIISETDNGYLKELESAINNVEKYKPILRRYTLILLNNQKFLHARTKILDRRRHLLRIRFNKSLPYDLFSIYDETKLIREYLTFSNDFYDYFDSQHKYLFKILNLIVEQYSQSTSIGETIRQTFDFDSKTHDIITKLNIHRTTYELGLYRPDIIFSQGSSFKMNNKYLFQPKLCEINARFAFNGYFLSAALCSTDRHNRISVNFKKLIEKIVKRSKFDTNKSMFILKSKEDGFDIHLFQQFWIKTYGQSCFVINPNNIKLVNDQLIDENTKNRIEQFIFELHQDEILGLPNDILEFMITNKQLNYINDFRTIFILHDKRLFSLLSNQQFLYALLNHDQETIRNIIPTTFVIRSIPDYLKESIINNKQHWCIKPNSSGKGQDVIIGVDVTSGEWSRQLLDIRHEQWIVQQYIECIQYKSMNLSGMLFCHNDQCFNIGIIRLSPNKVVNISHGGHYIRPYIYQYKNHSMKDGKILTKTQLHEQLTEFRWTDTQWNKSVYLSSSGGSGGKRLFFSTDIKENLMQRQILVNMMIDENVISDNDVCLNLFQSNNIYRSFEIFNDFCSMANCTTIPMSASADDQTILEMIEYFKPNIIMGSPYRLVQLAIYIEKVSKTDVYFDKVYFACQSMDKTNENYLRSVFHCSTFIGFYGSAEAGVFACQAPKYSSTKLYLYPKELVHIEIVNSHVIVTNLIRKRNQLIRFNMGDLGKIILGNDQNHKYGLIEIYSSQRLILIGDDSIEKVDIENMMCEIHLIEWQLIIDHIPIRNNHRTLLLFQYVCTESTVTELVEDNIRSNLQKLFDVPLETISEKLILQLQAIQYDNLIRDKVSGKVLKIIDKRL